PTFLDESRATLTRLKTFSQDANPLITQLHPAARALSGVLKPTAKVAPSFRDFFVGLKKTAKRAPAGFGALRALLDTDLPPVLSELVPFTQQLTPLVGLIGRYQHDITGFLGNVTGATNAQNTGESGVQSHYIRSSPPINPESLADFGSVLTPASAHRLTYSRTNPYNPPDTALKVATGLETFDPRPCSSPPGVTVGFGPDAVYTGNPNFANRAYFQDTPQDILDEIKKFAFTGQNTSAGLPAPACTKQAAQPSLGQIPEMTDYTHVYQGSP